MSDVAGDVGRHAVLVDAGYLYASVGQLVLGRTTRREFRVAAEPLIGALLARADRATPGELLRMYWYDAARDRVHTVEQRQIAALPHVKVRLGNLNSAGQQKGVDAQLRQDLEVLARHRAVTDVVLIAGDEDMVPAVEAAQAYGVRVHVWGVEPPYGVNQAERLVWEADSVDQLDAEFCRPYVEVEPAAVEESVEPEPREDKPAVPTPADVFAARKLPGPAPRSVAAAPAPVPSASPDRPGPERPEMEQIGAKIAARWLLTRGRENVADLLPGPVLPTVIDKELLVEAEEEISRSLRPYEEARRALRDGFWAKLHHEFGIATTSHPADPAHPTPASHPGPAIAHPVPVRTGPGHDAAHSGPAPASHPLPASTPAASRTGPAQDGAPAGASGPAQDGPPAGASGPAHPGLASAHPVPVRTGPGHDAAHSGPVPASHPVPASAPAASSPGPAQDGAHPGPTQDGAHPGPTPAGHPGPAYLGSAQPAASRAGPAQDGARPGRAAAGQPGPASGQPGQQSPDGNGPVQSGADGSARPGAGRAPVPPASDSAAQSTPAHG